MDIGNVADEMNQGAVGRIVALTPRELDILGQIVGGASNKAIAVNLSMSRNTVKTYVSNVLAKLQAHNRTEAAMKAVWLGLVELEECDEQ